MTHPRETASGVFRCTTENLEVVMSTSMSDRYRTVSPWLACMSALGTAFWLLRQQMLTSETGIPGQNGTEPPAVSAWQEAVDVSATPYPALVLRVKNGSDVAVHDVTLRAVVGVLGTFVRKPGSMEPQETREIRIAVPAPPRSANVTPDIMFADANKRYWLRSASGQVAQVSSPDTVDFNEDPGAYADKDHPTLHLPLSADAASGRRVN
jgi:hypothetical protein